MSVKSKPGARVRMLSWPVFSLTLGGLIAGVGVARASGPVLPTGGKVVSGSAAIGAPGAGALTVTQSSSKAILDWTSFSIGSGGKVAFDNGKGATLNRVTGGGVSSLDGLLSATGSVYLINPNGVIIGRSGVVDVGGTFAASTLDTSDAGFLKGGALGFSGASTAQVANLGKVGALGGDVALIAAQVSNAGFISAPNGSAGLLAGRSVVMLRDGSLDQGRFSVLLGGAGASITNIGTIAAADAELRAEGGNVYALGGDTSGVIRATGVKSGGGKVWLVADGGELDLGGAISAQSLGGTAGVIETSGGSVKIGDVRIDAHGGNWLVDPYDLTIDATAASTIDQALNAGTSVTEQTTATGYGGAGVASASGKGDITVAAPITWSTNAGLTLSAYRNINVDAAVNSSGGGAVTLYADNSGVGVGAVNFGSPTTVSTAGAVNIFYDPASNPAGSGVNSTSYTNPTDYSAHVQGGGALTSYMLVNTVDDLQNIQNNLTSTYAVGRDIDATATINWNVNAEGVAAGFRPIGKSVYDPPAAFSGTLDGQGHTISNLTVNANGEDYSGIFALLSGVTRNLVINNASIIGANNTGALAGEAQDAEIDNVTVSGHVGYNGSSVGGLAGYVIGSHLSNDSSSSTVIGNSFVGGLVGAAGDIGTAIVASYATGSVTGLENVGGLIGTNFGVLVSDYASGPVVGVAAGSPANLQMGFGGLAGANGGSISRSYATGSVTHQVVADPQNDFGSVGGLVGLDTNADGGDISKSYASGAVSGRIAGGLVGYNEGPITDAYAVGAVTSTGGYAGGLVGQNPFGTITRAYASGKVSGVGAAGLIGEGNDTSNSYWDTTTTGQTQARGSANLSGAPATSSAVPVNAQNAFSATTYTNLTFGPSGAWVILDGQTRPLLAVEYSTTIINAHQLQLVALNLAANYTVAADIDASGTSNPSEVWGPAGFVPVGAAIANGGTPYSGVFDGAGHTVSGVLIARPTSDYVGLFGDVGAGGVLQNVALSGGSVTGADRVGALAGQNDGLIRNASAAVPVTAVDYDEKGDYGYSAGGLVGLNTGTIDNASASGAVAGYGNVGGLVGGNEADPGVAVVENSHATGDVLEQGGYDGGGLVGQSATYNVTTPSLINDYASGRVTGTGYDGGLAGDVNSGLVQASYATGAVSATTAQLSASPNYGQGYDAGGLIGYIGHIQAATLLDDSASGAVAGVMQVGGLVGGMRAPTTTYPASVTITDVSATGAVSGAGLVGGLIGYNEASVTRGYASGAVGETSGAATELGGLVGENVGALTNSAASGQVQGDSEIGGLVGENYGSISGSYASGFVNAGLGKTAVRSGQIVGGLVGLNSGTITGSRATGHISADQIAGGLVGFDVGTISSSYATGEVDGASGKNTPSGSGTQIGGLVGASIGAVSTSYATGVVTGTGDLGGLVGFNGSSASVISSYATGRVTASSSQASNAGGLVGVNYGMLSKDYATGAVKAYSGIGGLIGYNDGQVVDTYATGAVSGYSGKAGLVGVSDQGGSISTSYATGAGGYGFVAINNGSLANDVFDAGATMTSAGVGAGSRAGLTAIGGSTGLDPDQASSYVGFDFTNVWTLQPGSSRPYLISNPQTPPPS